MGGVCGCTCVTAQGQGDLQGRSLSLYAAKKKAEGTRVLGALGNFQTENYLIFLLLHLCFMENCRGSSRFALNDLRNEGKISVHVELPYVSCFWFQTRNECPFFLTK